MTKAEIALNKFKAMNNESASKMLNIENSLSKNKQLPADSSKSKLEKMHKEMNLVNSFKKASTPNNVKIEHNVGAYPFQNQNSFFAVSK